MNWEYLLHVLLSVIGATWAVDCYKCVYDASQSESKSAWSVVSISFKPNTYACEYPESRGASVESCGMLTTRCLTVEFTKSDGYKYVSRGCTMATAVTCHNTTLPVSAFGRKYEAKHFCCKYSRCNGATVPATRATMVFSVVALSLVLSRFI